MSDAYQYLNSIGNRTCGYMSDGVEFRFTGINIVMAKDEEINWGKFGCVSGIVVIIVSFLALNKNCQRSTSAAWSSVAGADWLVVQYSQNGDVINYWTLTNKSVGNEGSSDGIYFIDDDGSVVHLSGHYVYVERKEASWDSLKKKYLKQ